MPWRQAPRRCRCSEIRGCFRLVMKGRVKIYVVIVSAQSAAISSGDAWSRKTHWIELGRKLLARLRLHLPGLHRITGNVHATIVGVIFLTPFHTVYGTYILQAQKAALAATYSSLGKGGNRTPVKPTPSGTIGSPYDRSAPGLQNSKVLRS